MATAKHKTDEDDDLPQGLQVKPRPGSTIYIGKRAEILAAGILPADVLPQKFQEFAVVHDGRRIKGGKWGCGNWARWELFVFHEYKTPTLTLIQGRKPASE